MSSPPQRRPAESLTPPSTESGNLVATDGWTRPAGPLPKAASTFIVTRLTTSVTHGLTSGSHCSASFEIHQFVPVANTPAPLGAV